MGRSSFQSNSVMQSRKKRSFSLPRLSAAGEQQEEAESAARVQKAAAWQWYTRGVGEAVVPTKRPAPVKSPPSPAPIHDAGDDAIPHNSNVLHKKPLKPALAESLRGASRFKAELARPPSAANKLQPTPSAPSAAPNSTPLYDELELSGLRTQMAEFVQRLQLHQQTQMRSPLAQIKSKPSLHFAVDGRPLPAAASVSTDHRHTKVEPPPAAAGACSSDHQLTKPPPSAAPVANSTIPFHMRPFSALHKLFRKVVSGSILKSTKNSPLMTPVYIHEPEVLPEDLHHFHHYIHHHHHHYHYGESPEESATITPRRRRHTDSSSIRPQTPSLLEAESDEEEEEAERSAIEAYLSGRRRHSDSFAAYLNARKAAFDEEEEMKVEESAMAASQVQFDQRRYNSERFTPNKIPTMLGEELAEPATEKCDEGFPDLRSRRRRAAENEREGAALERKAEGGGKSGGGTYKLGGGKSGEGTYKLGGGAAGSATAAIKPLVRRRHSEGLQRPEGVHCASPGKAYRHSPSARYLEDVLQRQIGASGPAAAARPPRPRPIYPQ